MGRLYSCSYCQIGDALWLLGLEISRHTEQSMKPVDPTFMDIMAFTSHVAIMGTWSYWAYYGYVIGIFERGRSKGINPKKSAVVPLR